ncbi:MAG TPA: hypothetical protein DIC22_08090 [Chitinophagaceae bacterium]|nr:hypothetical protein [Chitinophagaceae bacterium]
MKPVLRLLTLVLFLSLSDSIFAANRYWVSAVASNWGNPANWSAVSGGPGGATVPGAADAVFFNNGGLGNCTIDGSGTILSISIAAGYTGTLFQGANNISIVNNAGFAGGRFTAGSGNITIGGNITFSGGLFTGGSGNITVGGTGSFTGGIFSGGAGNITFAGNFTLNGTAFTSSSGVLEFDRSSAFTSATFSNNNGTVRYNPTGNATISGISPTFNILEFKGNGYSFNMTSTGIIRVTKSLNLTGTSFYNLNTGTINVQGDISVTNTAAGCAGSALININGAGIQNFTGSSGAGLGALPRITINKASGSLNLFNFPSSSNTFNYIFGTVNAGSSTYCFTNGSASPYTISGSLGLNNIEFIANTNQTFTISAATTLTANGDLTMAGNKRIILNTGKINVNGNIFLTNTSTAGTGTATIYIVGAGNQAMDGTTIAISQNRLPNVTINKTGGTLTMKGNISVSRNWTYTSGTVDATGFNSTVAFGGNNLNVSSAGMSFYNVTVTANVITLLNSMTLNNNLAINAGRLAPGANTVQIAGNWDNYGTAGFTEATSTVNFIGSGLQTITTPGGENFTNLTVNNSGPGIQLNNNTTIATLFKMTLGNINLNGNTISLGVSIANNGTLNYAAGTMYGAGTFIRWFKNALIPNGSVNGLFPMGTATDYRPFYVSAPVAGPTTGGTIQVTYNDATTNTTTPTYPDGAATIQVRKDLNWAVATASGLAGGTYNLDVQGTGFGLIGAVSDLRLTLAASVVGLPGVNAGTTINPQVNRTGLTLANLNNSFYIGSINSVSTPLPITLISFTASVVNGEVLLYWTTAAEINNDYFTIQRSRDVAGWENIQKVPGAGNSSTDHTYSTKDQSPFTGISYYRLMQTDIDGKFTYSQVISVNLGNKLSEINLFPNPATDRVNILFNVSGKYEVALLNSNGQFMIHPVLINGLNTVLNVSELKSGIYFIRIRHDGIQETRKVLISR